MSDTLLINADGQPVNFLPVSTVNWQEAIRYLYQDKCDVLDWYDDWVVRSPSWETKVPSVIMLRQYLKTDRNPKFSKLNVLLRDQYKCLYCGCSVTRQTATMDHVIPQARGGKTKWNNIVTACVSCNTQKADKNLMKPLYKPYKPGHWELVRKRKQLPFSIKHPSWNQWLNSEL